MSLRDELLKAGLVGKKKHRAVNRELKQKRKRRQSQRERKSAVRAREEAQAQATRDAEVARRTEDRQRHAAAEHAKERRRLITNLLRGYAVPLRPGPVPFFHRTPTPPLLHRLKLAGSVAWDLRRGTLAIAWLGHPPDDVDYILLKAMAARRIQQHDPDRVVFFVNEPGDPSDPSEAPYDA